MRRSRFTDDDIAALLAQAERGRAVAEVCAEAGVTERTFYRWRAKFGAPPLRAIHALQRLEQENRALKRAVLRAGAPGLALLTMIAFSSALRVRMSEGFRSSHTISTIRLPVS